MKNSDAKFVHPNTHHIYTDGSYRPEGNAACAYLIFSEKTKHIVKMARYVCRGRTINQMELMAINHALDKPNMDYVIIYSDSMYSIQCLTIWRKMWKERDWKTPLGDPVKNKELIQEIGEKIDRLKYCRFVKVAAHSGDKFNSVVDYQASELTALMVQDSLIPDGEYPCR